MTWLSINPNSLSDDVKAACKEILVLTSNRELKPEEYAMAFNLLDPEIVGYTASERGDATREEAEWRSDFNLSEEE